MALFTTDRSRHTAMDCAEFDTMVQAFVDGEFDGRERLECEVHLSTCEACRRKVRRISLFRDTFRQSYTPDRAPDALRDRLMRSLEGLAQQEAQQAAPQEPKAQEPAPVVALPVPPMNPAPPGERKAKPWLLWFQAAAGVALVAGTSAAIYHFATRPQDLQGASPAAALRADGVDAGADAAPNSNTIVTESVQWHQRNLPIEVTGPSDEQVRYWFRDKVNFPVRLPRFDRASHRQVNLLGARLSHLREKQAAYVVYESDGNKVSVMVFDGQGVKRLAPAPRQDPRVYNANGYNVAIVEDNGVTYSITSELPREDMVQLVDAAFHPTP